MDSHAHANKTYCKYICTFAFSFFYSGHALASGDVIVVYISILSILAFITAATLILIKLKSKARIKSIILFIIFFLLDYKIAFSIPFNENKWLILISYFFSISFLFLYIFHQIKSIKK